MKMHGPLTYIVKHYNNKIPLRLTADNRICFINNAGIHCETQCHIPLCHK